MTAATPAPAAAAPAPAANAPAAEAPTPPAPSADTTMAGPAAAAMASAGGGGGGGGCTVVRDGAPELALPLAVLWALAMITRRLVTRQRNARTVDLPARA